MWHADLAACRMQPYVGVAGCVATLLIEAGRMPCGTGVAASFRH
jgi:hypothetical protein